MDLLAYEGYFSNLVAISKKINSFYHIDMFEFKSFENDLRGGRFAAPMLILESYNLGTIAEKLDNITDVHDGALVLLGKFDPKLLNNANKTTFLAEVESIIRQIRTKMLNDKRIQCHFMNGLVPESMKIEKTDIIGGCFMGYRMAFTIESCNDNEIDGDFWNL